MVASLSDFNKPVETPSLSEFFAGARQTNNINPATTSNIAAHVAAMSNPVQAESVYSRVNNELSSSSSSVTMDSIMSEWDSVDYSQNLEAVQNIINSEDYTIEQKEAAVRTLSQAQRPSVYSRLAQISLMADSEPDDNDEVEFTRINTSSILDQVDIYQGAMQQQINLLSSSYNQDILTNLTDFTKLLFPFYEQANLAELANVINGETEGNQAAAVVQALTIMGESKTTLRDAIRSLDIEDRTKVAQTILDYVSQGHGPQSNDPNQLLAITQLQQLMTTGGYTGTDRFIDNLVSVMDDTIILSPFSKGLGRIIGGAVEAIKPTSRATAGSIRRYEAAIQSLSGEEVVSDITRILDEGSEVLSDSLSTTDKLTARQTMEDMVYERVKETMDEETLDLVSDDLRAAINARMDDVIPGVDNSQTTTVLLQDINSSLSRRIIAGEGAEAAPDVAQVFRSNASRDTVRSSSNPSSLINVYQRTNPNKTRAIIETITRDNSNRSANIMAQTSKNDAIGDAFLPEVGKTDGSVRQKVSLEEGSFPQPDEATINRIKEVRGDIEWTTNEKAAKRAQVKDEWRDVVGLVPRKEMSTISDISTGIRMDMVYGPKDGGFRNANQALEQVKFGLRKYGITDDNIEILTSSAEGYRPMTSADDWSKEGNYLARVKYDYEFSLTDTRHFDTLKSTRWKFADIRTPFDKSFGGTLQHLVPSTAIINKALINAASVASDFSAFIGRRLFELGKEYATKYNSLNKRQKYLVDTYIIEANEKGLKFDPVKLQSRGMTDTAVDTVRAWKKNWDTIYHFENIDLNKTLRARGYQKFVSQGQDTDLIVRPLARNQVSGDNVRVWSAEDGGKALNLSRKEITELYENGGNIARARSAVEIEDDVFEFVLVKNNSEESYTRSLRDDDYTLAYRDGYYTVRYDSPFFIVKTITDKNGKTFEKAIATAETRRDAERYLDRLRSTDEEGSYDFRQARDAEDFDTLDWSNTVQNGRSTQKVRGQRLKDVSQTISDLNYKHIETPEESLIRSIQSISNRTSHRNFIEVSKARWLNQFKHLLSEKEKWPENVNLIGKGSASYDLSTLRDATTTWRYIDTIENGYNDLLDDLTKTFFKGISDVSGRAGWGHIEKLANKAEQLNINRFARRKAFRLLLASNPLRQVWVQSSQALPVIASLNPTFLARLPGQMSLMNYMKNGGDLNSFFKSVAENLTGLTLDEAKTMIKHYQDSGIEEFVTAHTYMREHMSKLVDRKLSTKFSTAVGKPLDVTQKIGFEAGENMLMSSIWLSEYDKLRRAGASINREVLDNLNAKVRHLTGNMNRAGDMPYNQNALSGLMQFFATPHKIFAQVFMGHTGLTSTERARLAAGYVLTYGTGAGIVTDQIMRMLPPDVDAATRDVVENGFAQLLLNKTLSHLYGEEVNIAFSESFRIGVEQPNLGLFIEDLLAMNVGSIVSNSPSGSYVFGDNPKFNNFIRQLMKPFTVPQDEALEETVMIGRTFLDMFTGASNFFKAKYILEHGQNINSTGRIVDSDVNPLEGLMRAAGFSTMDEVHYYASQERYYRNSSQPYDDVKQFVSEISRRLAMEGINNQDADYWLRIFAEAQRVYGHDPFYNNILMSEIRSRADSPIGENQIYEWAIRLANHMSESDFEDFLRNGPLDEETKDNLRNINTIIRESR